MMNALRLFPLVCFDSLAHRIFPFKLATLLSFGLISQGFYTVTDANVITHQSNTECNPSITDTQSPQQAERLASTSHLKFTGSAPTYRYRVIARYPHDSKAFTEGLLFHDNRLFESTGLLGKSTLREVDIATGAIIKQHDVSGYYFAEGLTNFKNKLVQLTWKRGRAFLYDFETLNINDTFDLPGETWGVTTIDKLLVISNGTSELIFYDPNSQKIVKTLNVHDQGRKIQGLNELEYADGRLYANVWPTPCIAEISPGTGAVQGWLNLSALLPAPTTNWKNVMNGIAYDSDKKRFFITGKHWPYLYEIEKLAANSEFQTNQ